MDGGRIGETFAACCTVNSRRISRFATAIGVGAAPAFAQSAARDSLTHALDTVVITAQRTSSSIASSSAAVSRLSKETLDRLPVRNVGDALQYVPGIVVIHGDGIGDAPRIIARGFYGGGETEYVAVLIDGIPTSEAASGAVNWDLVPISSVRAIEVVRGGSSSLYGDAAIGGVINLITKRSSDAHAQWRVTGGGFGYAQAASRFNVGSATLFGDVARTDGYRAHEARKTWVLGGTLDIVSSPDRALTLGTLSSSRRFEDPGALSETAIAANRRASSPFHRFDVTKQSVNRVTLDGREKIGRVLFSAYAAGELASSNAILTLPLSASFGDTKGRLVDSRRALGSMQAEYGGVWRGLVHRVVVGSDASLGSLISTYRSLVSGASSAYVGSPTLADPEARGTGRRTAAAGFVEWHLSPAEPLRIDVGVRYDAISDRYSPSAPARQETSYKSRDAWSPRIGANLRYADGGTVFVSANGAFKAPTMDQLYDQRGIPVPFPPYSVTLSNTRLRPQTLRGLEAGFYHRIADANLSMAVYQMDMRDELDFDLEQFRYVNIGRSRHRGLEVSVSASGPLGLTVFSNATVQSAVSQFGEKSGQQLRGIPRQAWTAGVSRAASNGIATSLTGTVIGSSFLDDDNTTTIAGYTRFDLRASLPLRHMRLTIDVRNLLDRSYNSTGYPDPGGSPERFFYPAAGRVLLIGLGSR